MQDKKTCKVLKSERAEFLGSGILDDMSKGPDWVKDNLAADKIDRIKRFLILDGTVSFQCRGGGPAIQGKKKAASKAASAKKKRIRKKIYREKKKSSGASFQPFASN